MGKFKFSLLVILFLSLIYCNPGLDYQEELKIDETSGKDYGNVAQLLKDTFRIDIKTISVDMEYFPELFYVNCEAEVVFTMYNDMKPINWRLA